MATVSEFLRDVNFESFISDLNQGGWFQFVFPFMLVYAVVLTILNKVEIFEDRKSVKVIIAMIFALFAIAFPISDNSNCGLSSNGWAYNSNGCTLGDMMMTLFPGVSAFSVGILALYIVAAMLGVDLMAFFGNNEKDNWLRYVLGGLGVLVVAYYYARGFGWGGWDSGSALQEFFEDPMLYILILFGLFFWYVTNEDTGDEVSKKKSSHNSHAHGGHEHDAHSHGGGHGN